MKEAKVAMTQHGMLRKGSDAKSAPFKIPTSDQLSSKRVDAAKLEVSYLIFKFSKKGFLKASLPHLKYLLFYILPNYL